MEPERRFDIDDQAVFGKNQIEIPDDRQRPIVGPRFDLDFWLYVRPALWKFGLAPTFERLDTFIDDGRDVPALAIPVIRHVEAKGVVVSFDRRFHRFVSGHQP